MPPSFSYTLTQLLLNTFICSQLLLPNTFSFVKSTLKILAPYCTFQPLHCVFSNSFSNLEWSVHRLLWLKEIVHASSLLNCDWWCQAESQLGDVHNQTHPGSGSKSGSGCCQLSTAEITNTRSYKWSKLSTSQAPRYSFRKAEWSGDNQTGPRAKWEWLLSELSV